MTQIMELVLHRDEIMAVTDMSAADLPSFLRNTLPQWALGIEEMDKVICARSFY